MNFTSVWLGNVQRSTPNAQRSTKNAGALGVEHSSSCNHALAPIAQIGMRVARADSWPITPAARALLVRRSRHRSGRFFRLMERQVTHNEEFFQFLLINLLCHIGIRMQDYVGFQSVADEFLLTCPLDGLPDYTAQSQKLRHLMAGLIASILRQRKFLQMNRRACFRIAPAFLGGKGENR